jgi:hypothetical protein
MEHFGGANAATNNHFDHFGAGLHEHAMHHYGRFRRGYGFYDSYSPDCYDLNYQHPTYPWPPYCG